DELTARVVEDLPGHGVEVEARLEPAHGAEVERQEIEEERAVGLGGERDELALGGRVRPVVDVLEVRRLSAEAGTVVNDLAVDLLRGYSRKRLSMSSSVISANGES